MTDSHDEKGARETEDLLSGFDRPQRPSRRSGPSSEDFVDYHERVSSEPIAPPRSRPLPRAKTTSAAIPKNELPSWLKWGALAFAALALALVAVVAWNLTPAPKPQQVGLVPTAPSTPVQASLPPPSTAVPDPEPEPAPIATTPKATARRPAAPPSSAKPGPTAKASAEGFIREPF